MSDTQAAVAAGKGSYSNSVIGGGAGGAVATLLVFLNPGGWLPVDISSEAVAGITAAITVLAGVMFGVLRQVLAKAGITLPSTFGLILAVGLAGGLAGCAGGPFGGKSSLTQDTGNPQVDAYVNGIKRIAVLCDSYNGSLQILAAMIVNDELSAEAETTMDGVMAVVGPICLDPTPPTPLDMAGLIATIQPQIYRLLILKVGNPWSEQKS